MRPPHFMYKEGVDAASAPRLCIGHKQTTSSVAARIIREIVMEHIFPRREVPVFSWSRAIAFCDVDEAERSDDEGGEECFIHGPVLPVQRLPARYLPLEAVRQRAPALECLGSDREHLLSLRALRRRYGGDGGRGVSR